LDEVIQKLGLVRWTIEIELIAASAKLTITFRISSAVFKRERVAHVGILIACEVFGL
jgi:hypothetical protein